MRESFRRDKDGSFTVSRAPNSLQKAVTQLNDIIHFEKIIELTSNTEAHTRVRRPTTVRACSSFSAVPNILSRSRTPPTGYNRRHQQPALGVRNNMIRRARGSQTDNFGQQFISSDAMMKNKMFGGSVFMTNQAQYGTSDDMNIVSGATYTTNVIPLAAPRDFDSSEQQNGLPDIQVNMNSICEVPSSQPDISAVADALASLSEVYPQPVCQSINNSQNVWQLDNRTAVANDPASLDFNFRWVDEMNNQQSSVEDIHRRNGTMNDEDQARVNHCGSQFPGNFPLHYQDDNYGSWSIGQSVTPVAPAERVASDMNKYSPESAGLDADVLGNYFETSWSGSTHN
ncbi:hypothetical protein LINPERHAP2_LOCUS37176 [Linum perenne]